MILLILAAATCVVVGQNTTTTTQVTGPLTPWTTALTSPSTPVAPKGPTREEIAALLLRFPQIDQLDEYCRVNASSDSLPCGIVMSVVRLAFGGVQRGQTLGRSYTELREMVAARGDHVLEELLGKLDPTSMDTLDQRLSVLDSSVTSMSNQTNVNTLSLSEAQEAIATVSRTQMELARELQGIKTAIQTIVDNAAVREQENLARLASRVEDTERLITTVTGILSPEKIVTLSRFLDNSTEQTTSATTATPQDNATTMAAGRRRLLQATDDPPITASQYVADVRLATGEKVANVFYITRNTLSNLQHDRVVTYVDNPEEVVVVLIIFNVVAVALTMASLFFCGGTIRFLIKRGKAAIRVGEFATGLYRITRRPHRALLETQVSLGSFVQTMALRADPSTMEVIVKYQIKETARASRFGEGVILRPGAAKSLCVSIGRINPWCTPDEFVALRPQIPFIPLDQTGFPLPHNRNGEKVREHMIRVYMLDQLWTGICASFKMLTEDGMKHFLPFMLDDATYLSTKSGQYQRLKPLAVLICLPRTILMTIPTANGVIGKGSYMSPDVVDDLFLPPGHSPECECSECDKVGEFSSTYRTVFGTKSKEAGYVSAHGPEDITVTLKDVEDANVNVGRVMQPSHRIAGEKKVRAAFKDDARQDGEGPKKVKTDGVHIPVFAEDVV